MRRLTVLLLALAATVATTVTALPQASATDVTWTKTGSGTLNNISGIVAAPGGWLVARDNKKAGQNRVALLSDVGIRNVSSNAPLNTTMRRGSVMGNESIVLAGRIEVVDRDTGDVERVRADMEGAYAEDSKLGIRTISSVSNVRASTTWSKDVCCNNTQRRPSAFPSRLGRRHSAREPCHAPL